MTRWTPESSRVRSETVCPRAGGQNILFPEPRQCLVQPELKPQLGRTQASGTRLGSPRALPALPAQPSAPSQASDTL